MVPRKTPKEGPGRGYLNPKAKKKADRMVVNQSFNGM
jgi:hypothetical protein